MEKSFIFDSINGDRKYNAQDFREYFASFIGNGIFINPSTNLQVIANNNMTVTLKPGKAWVKGALYSNTEDTILNIDTADGILNRIDRVILRFDTIQRKIHVYIKKGQLSSSPISCELQRDVDAYELAIANININKGMISILQFNITDTRMDKNLCGIVHGTVEQADLTTIFNQYLSWYKDITQNSQSDINNIKAELAKDFNTWFKTIKDTLSGDVAGNLLSKINEIPKIFEGTVEPNGIRSGDFWLKEV